jgi:hypothetical protein
MQQEAATPYSRNMGAKIAAKAIYRCELQHIRFEQNGLFRRQSKASPWWGEAPFEPTLERSEASNASFSPSFRDPEMLARTRASFVGRVGSTGVSPHP